MFDSERLRRLRAIGLAPPLEHRLAALRPGGDDDALQPLRVTEVQRDALTVHDGRDERRARALPSLLQALADEGDALAVGDWVLGAANSLGECWVQARAAPLTQLARRSRASHGDGLARRVIVANVDTALLVMGLDCDFSVPRLERYLAMTRAAGVAAVVVLTKADACDGIGARLVEAGRVLRPAEDALAVDARAPAVAQALAPWLGEGQTLVMVGSSGAGKSTLTNTLLGADVQATGAVRGGDSRGRHTTSARTLHRLTGGACIVDTPGLRTLRLDADEDDVRAAFDDIAALSLRCRFRDCAHHDEPGCAVREGVAHERLRNFHKLQREARRDTMTVLERREQVAAWKARARAAHARDRAKRG